MSSRTPFLVRLDCPVLYFVQSSGKPIQIDNFISQISAHRDGCPCAGVPTDVASSPRVYVYATPTSQCKSKVRRVFRHLDRIVVDGHDGLVWLFRVGHRPEHLQPLRRGSHHAGPFPQLLRSYHRHNISVIVGASRSALYLPLKKSIRRVEVSHVCTDRSNFGLKMGADSWATN